MNSQSVCILYKWPECWGLPSLSPACIQAEAYLRLSGVQFAVEVCSTSSSSPTGQLPALERDAYISPGASDEFSSAAAVVAYAKKHIKDLDAHLSLGQRADQLAFTTLIESRLNVATNMTMWCESRGFNELKKAAYGAKLPFPLNQLVPWSRQREVRRRLAHTDMDQVYPAALEVLDAVSDRLRSGGGPYFFGPQPTSVDALLLGHLLFYRTSPAVAPVLQEKVQSQRVLCEYIERLLGQNFSVPATPRSALESSSAGAASWSDAAKGQKKAPPPAVAPSPAELQFRRHSYYWLLGAGATIVSYILMSGRYIQFATVIDGDGEDEGDDDEEDDADDE
ncbi:hypothetical protein PLESTB_000477700 [Pleodorina starrii]|uniref:Metaxin n=1 Tax=Pleodorina starrii TaxID=330485 RepID=A0A9W6F0K8_9CHLO|nr:hypothetical protein PLESTM_001588800 [Pleodorina starrii]GLC51211.1 hypothetical protein PLESTB_000477700 [Pleodorina starrii]GLC63570.1 hypothetical protein PLESTF_000050300 [Pleodorina starrii]